MNTRTARPLLGIAISGALLLGSAFIASPALAADISPTVDARSAATGHHGSSVAIPEQNAAPTRSTTRRNLKPADSDPSALTGSYTLSSDAAWVGQTVSLTEVSVSADAVTRTVNWGDGSAPVTLVAGQTAVTKSYAVVGTYTVSVTLTDAAGTAAAAVVDQPVLSISRPGTLTLSKTAVWIGEPFRLTIAGVQPAVTSQIVLDWGDGYQDTFPGVSRRIDTFYYRHAGKNGKLMSGTVHLTATFYNKLGTATVTGSIAIRRDAWRPTAGISVPKNSNRVSSWTYVRGTAADKGSGIYGVYVWVTMVSGQKIYCYTPTKKWKRVYNQTQLNNCAANKVGVSRGRWSVRMYGLAKNTTIYVDVISADQSDNLSKQASTHVKLTR